MSYLLFAVYFLIACYLLYKSTLLRKTGLPIYYWLLFFFIKTCAGCYYGFWYAKPQNIATADTWRFHKDALAEYHLLFQNPYKYATNLFHNAYSDLHGVFAAKGYWRDLKDNLMLKVFSVFDLFSGGHYYVNVVIYSFITLFGFVFFILACKTIFKKEKVSFITAIVLLSASCLFWTSGIHRDGFVLLFTSLCCWYWTKMIYNGYKKDWIKWLLSFLALIIFRIHVATLFLPAFIIWAIAKKYRFRYNLAFPIATVLMVVIFFLTPVIVPRINFAGQVVTRYEDFDRLSGNSKLPPLQLEGTFTSFIQNFPAAFDYAFFRPYLWQANSAMEIIASIEAIVSLCFIVCCFIWRDRQTESEMIGFNWTIALFCVVNIILMGYIVPFAGAIVRYRSIFIMLLLVVSSFNLKEMKTGRKTQQLPSL